MRIAQFIEAGSGLGTAGKNMKTKATIRKQAAMMLTGIPSRPRLNLEGGNSSFRSLFAIRVLITRRYDAKRPVALTESIILKAVVDPMMISARRTVNANVT